MNNNRRSSNSRNISNILQRAYDFLTGTCIRCLEPGHWRECAAYVHSIVGTKGRNKASENVCCLASVLLGTSKLNSSKITAAKWVADSGVTYRMTRSADIMHDIRPSSDKDRICDNGMIDIVGYGLLTVVFPRSFSV